jgi:biotin operon repressor
MTKRLDIPPSLLKRLYYDEGLSQCQIAGRLGCSDDTVNRRMREYGFAALVRHSKRIGIPRAVLERLYNDEGLPIPQVAQRLGCSEATVWRRMRDCGIAARSPGTYCRLDIPRELLERPYHEEGIAQAEIAERLECSVTAVSQHIATHGVEACPCGPIAGGAAPEDKTWRWTPELAYAVGLIATDGNLPRQNGNDVIFVSTDRELHDVYQRCLGVSVPITEGPRRGGRKIVYTTTINSPRLRSLLEEIGLAPANGKTLGLLAVPDEFFRDFFRGCIDGDGSVMLLKFEHHRYLSIALSSASKAFVGWIRATVMHLVGIRGRLYRVRQGVWRLDYAYRNGKQIAEWMYHSPGLPCLQRKRARYEELLQLKGMAEA